jgi:hypothetical protein
MMSMSDLFRRLGLAFFFFINVYRSGFHFTPPDRPVLNPHEFYSYLKFMGVSEITDRSDGPHIEVGGRSGKHN